MILKGGYGRDTCLKSGRRESKLHSTKFLKSWDAANTTRKAVPCPLFLFLLLLLIFLLPPNLNHSSALPSYTALRSGFQGYGGGTASSRGRWDCCLSVRSPPPPTLIPPHSPSQAPYLPQAASSISEIHVLSHHSLSDHTGPAGGCNQETTGQS